LTNTCWAKRDYASVAVIPLLSKADLYPYPRLDTGAEVKN